MSDSYPRHSRPIHAGIQRYVFLGLISLLLVTVRSSDVLAHGGGTPVTADEPVGPYHVYVWIDPWPAETGRLHVTVAISETDPQDPEEQIPVLGADVTLSMEHPDETIESLSAQATHDQAVNKLMYEGDLIVEYPGEWRMTVSMEGEAGAYALELPVEVTGEAVEVIVRRDHWGNLWLWLQRLFERN